MWVDEILMWPFYDPWKNGEVWTWPGQGRILIQIFKYDLPEILIMMRINIIFVKH